MGKRTRSDSGELSHQPTHKKMGVPDALSRLSESADDLIQCLQALKTKRDDPSLTRRLAALSHDLMPSFKALAKGYDGKVADEGKAKEQAKPELAEHPQPEVPILTPWTPSEVAASIPPLPAILDPVLEKASFTHAGTIIGHSEQSYEQLEWLGDAYLYLMSTAYIYMTFPHLPHGEMCHLREVLVRNDTLREFSIHYGFEKRAILPKEYDIDGRHGGSKVSDKERAKVLGDIFEAYVAATILSDPVRGVSRTALWLKALWSTMIPKQIQRQGQPRLVAPVMGVGSSPGPQAKAKSAKEELSGLLALSNPRVNIVYKSVDESRTVRDPLTKQPLFVQAVYLEGYGETKQLGTGTAKKKADANMMAAQNALENKRLINTYKEKKRLALESREAQEKASKDLGF
ncbi:nucleolar RNAse III [Diaporthe helianthi]|uniref:Nucleolar RNAse III n=1 Tax=Diaporthe helianthi TaxID=158607 RepID=A0A2P5I5R0_DIAHE|nr:nucleolar RNAse III [Diaporthe helianthi]